MHVLYVSSPLAIFSISILPGATGSPSRAGSLTGALAPSSPILPFPRTCPDWLRISACPAWQRGTGRRTETGRERETVLQSNGKGGRAEAGRRRWTSGHGAGRRRQRDNATCLLAHVLLDANLGAFSFFFFFFGTLLLSSSSLLVPRIEQDEGREKRVSRKDRTAR